MTSRHGNPIFYKEGHPAFPLTNLRLGQRGHEGDHREEFLQTLVHDHPDVIPMAEIEPAYRPLISVCKELNTSAGSVDNVWITPEGGLILGECKLIRNPQSRREVVAQALDYARAVTGWHFDDLQAAVRNARKDPAFSLWGLVSGHTDLQEEQFCDAIERRLRFGRIMLLIISDGIHKGVEEEDEPHRRPWESRPAALVAGSNFLTPTDSTAGRGGSQDRRQSPLARPIRESAAFGPD